MSETPTIVGRGRVGRALAAASGAPLVARDGSPGPGPILLAVPDRAVAAMAARWPGRCVHLSGSLSLPDVPCAHPLTSFDGAPADWTGTPLALTGAVPESVVRLFEGLGFIPFELGAEHKARYHAAAVLSSGHAATLWLGATTLLDEVGVRLPGRGLWPLIEMTVRNVERRGAAGRTGPFVRGDEETIRRDREALPEAWAEVFERLGRLG
jgi:predicted short-subunit dehydrogenase-like oxidoreductase (DUF2520 family)